MIKISVVNIGSISISYHPRLRDTFRTDSVNGRNTEVSSIDERLKSKEEIYYPYYN